MSSLVLADPEEEGRGRQREAEEGSITSPTAASPHQPGEMSPEPF